jgi:GNAT superfamily N-acetyltransferase
MDPDIRLLSEDDSLEELTAMLHRAYVGLGAMGLNYTAVDQGVERTRERCEGGACFVAVANGKLVGTIKLDPPDPDEYIPEYRKPEVGSISQFGVEPDWQGSGLGQRLLKAALEQAHEWGLQAVALDTAIPARHLVSLYKGWGFEIVDEIQWPGKVYRSYVMRREM